MATIITDVNGRHWKDCEDATCPSFEHPEDLHAHECDAHGNIERAHGERVAHMIQARAKTVGNWWLSADDLSDLPEWSAALEDEPTQLECDAWDDFDTDEITLVDPDKTRKIPDTLSGTLPKPTPTQLPTWANELTWIPTLAELRSMQCTPPVNCRCVANYQDDAFIEQQRATFADKLAAIIVLLLVLFGFFAAFVGL